MTRQIIRAFAPVVLAAAVTALLSCGGSPTSASCLNGPYTFDTNVQRCRASGGQFAENVCCNR
jgi:hypothetical protein